jgi:protein PET100
MAQFGMYIMFPIGWMYYFGTNLDQKFSVPDFWPKPSQMHKIPYEREEIDSELERLKRRRLAMRKARLEEAMREGRDVSEEMGDEGGDVRVRSAIRGVRGGVLDRLGEGEVDVRSARREGWNSGKSWGDWIRGR